MARPATRPWSDDELVVKYPINAANITREYPRPAFNFFQPTLARSVPSPRTQSWHRQRRAINCTRCDFDGGAGLATYSVPCTCIRQRQPGQKPKSHQKNSILLEHMINFLEVGDRTSDVSANSRSATVMSPPGPEQRLIFFSQISSIKKAKHRGARVDCGQCAIPAPSPFPCPTPGLLKPSLLQPSAMSRVL
jgi:hypothetical protein